MIRNHNRNIITIANQRFMGWDRGVFFMAHNKNSLLIVVSSCFFWIFFIWQ